jgi:hypothetical protein
MTTRRVLEGNYTSHALALAASQRQAHRDGRTEVRFLAPGRPVYVVTVVDDSREAAAYDANVLASQDGDGA